MRPCYTCGLRPVGVIFRHTENSVATAEIAASFRILKQENAVDLIVLANLLIDLDAEAVLVDGVDGRLSRGIVNRDWVCHAGSE